MIRTGDAWAWYQLNGAECRAIAFYDPKTGIEVVRIKEGYLEDQTTGQRVIGINVPPAIRARKPLLRTSTPHFVVLPQDALGKRLKARPTAELYIPTTLATVSIGEEKIIDSDGQRIVYGREILIGVEGIILEFVKERPDQTWETKEVSIHEIRQEVTTRSELTKWGRDARELWQKMKTLKIGISLYDLERMMEHFNITVKEP